MLQERYQQPKDLVLQLHRPVISAKFAGAKVYLIPTEPDNASNLRHVFSRIARLCHGNAPGKYLS
jgi:hypothetical protein